MDHEELERAAEAPEAGQDPALREARDCISRLEQELAAAKRQEEARFAREIDRAAAESRDPEVAAMLLRRGGESVPEALAALRREKPYLFPEEGNRPVFAAPGQGRTLSREEDAVARRYRNNPWYRRKQ